MSIFLTSANEVRAQFAAQDVCAVTTNGRLHAVTYSTERILSVSGHSHGVTSEVLALARVADDIKTDNETYRQNSAQSLAALQETLVQYRQDVAAIKQQIREGRLKYIALEYGPKIMTYMQENARLFLPYLRRNLKLRGLKEASWMDDAHLIFAGPALYLRNVEPELMKEIKLVAVEDDELMQNSLDEIKKGEEHLGQLKRRTDVTGVSLKEAASLWEEIIENYDIRRYDISAPAIAVLKSKFPAASASDFDGALKAAMAAADVLRERDTRASKKFLAETGSGILLIGSSHLRAMSKIIQDDCLKQKKATAQESRGRPTSR